jgi:Ni,Fe-hydrogenase III large subunit
MSLKDIPKPDFGEFREHVLAAVARGDRLAALFGLRGSTGVVLYALLAGDSGHRLSAVAAEVGASYPSLTPECPQAHLFEREIFEQLAVRPEGHPWLKPVRAHGGTDYRWFTMNGEEVHEVAVGPVHAGVIEPGHFRFQCEGELVHHLEIRLGYQHRGVEEALYGGPHKRTMLQMETLAGDTSIGHGTAYCQVIESLSGAAVPEHGLVVRAVALELERLANHVGDLGALANDVGYLPTASYCGRLRGDFLNMTALICGSRLGRGLVRPGGVAFSVDQALADQLLERLATAQHDLKGPLGLFFETGSVENRLAGTGTVSAQTARELGLVGVAARGSGLPVDVRTSHPAGLYRTSFIPRADWTSGDVFARAKVRRLEISHSIRFIRDQLSGLRDKACRASVGALAPDSMAVGMVEGWRGEIVHVAITDGQGKFARYKVVDPSFHNWEGLAMAMRGGQISDFPLCNKSFNLSYCGFDL